MHNLVKKLSKLKNKMMLSLSLKGTETFVDKVEALKNKIIEAQEDAPDSDDIHDEAGANYHTKSPLQASGINETQKSKMHPDATPKQYIDIELATKNAVVEDKGSKYSLNDPHN